MTSYERIKEISEEMRQLAQELDITIVTTRQHPPAPRLVTLKQRAPYPTVAEHNTAMGKAVFVDHHGLLFHDLLEGEL